MSENRENYFARKNEDGNYSILHADGTPVTRIKNIAGLYPVGSDMSSQYEHPDGIVLTFADVVQLAINIE